jgi:hypothetical protein
MLQLHHELPGKNESKYWHPHSCNIKDMVKVDGEFTKVRLVDMVEKANLLRFGSIIPRLQSRPC